MKVSSRHALFASLWLLFSLPGQARDAPDPVAVDASFAPAEQAAKLLSVTEAKMLKGLGRVAVPQFSVEFITADNVSAETSGFAAAGRASVSAYYKLSGVGSAEFQAITEALHANFLRELQASGLEVVPNEQVLAAPSFRKLVAGGTPTPILGERAVTVTPPGMALYGGSLMVAESGKKAGMFSGLSAFSTAMSAVGAVADTQALQKELGDAALLEVYIRVHFVKLTNNNKGFFGRLSSTASVSAKAYPSVTTAQMSVHSGYYQGQLVLKQPLTFDAAAFSEVREEAKTGGDVAGAVLAGLINLASGSQNSSEYSRFEAIADAPKYREVVGTGLGQLSGMFVSRLKSER